MKIYRIETADGAVRLASEERGALRQLDGTLAQLMEQVAAGEAVRVGEALEMEGARILAPLEPGKIVCVGRNYAAHARELGNPLPTEPLLFTKPTTSIIGPEQSIELPPQSGEVQHEGELAVVIGRRATRVSREEALDYVLGYTCANDVTARDLQRADGRFTRAKGFDTFCPLGPALVTRDAYDPSQHWLECRVNGQVRQRSALNDWIFPIAELISYISDFMTLLPGDVVLTGTPAGVGPLVEGDMVEVEIEGIGVLRSHVSARPT